MTEPTAGGRPIPTYPDLAGKVALVTGGSKGIGAATCRMLAANHVRVAVNARSQAGIDAIVTELSDGGGEAIGLSADCTDLEALIGVRERVEQELGSIDILLPYAGGFGAFTPIEEIDEGEWREVIDVNLTATFLTVKAVLPSMIEREGGVIVTMSSNGGRLLDKLLTASYAAAKAGVIQFTRHIAMELGPRGIRANCIAPATVLSERVGRIMDEESRARTAAMSPLGTLGTPEDCALATLFLASDSSSWMTGVTLDVAGGRIML
ncbi:MAG: SDR family NAD(P)-dependent oxidoreductase [Solirubrobacterales bacterium]